MFNYRISKFRQRFTLVECDSSNMLDVLDALKVADAVLFLVSVAGIDSNSELLLTASLAQGLPSSATAVVDISTLPLKVSCII